MPSAPPPSDPAGSTAAPRPRLNPKYVFSNFVVGQNNNLASAASLAVAEALPVSTAKSDRLPWPPPAKPEPAIKPAEPFDYAQAEVEKKVRRAHAEAPDLCQSHGMHKVWTKDGKSWKCRK